MDLGDSLRFRTRMAPIVMKELADGCELEEVPSGYRLSWPGAEATFYRRYEAVTFSWVVDADPPPSTRAIGTSTVNRYSILGYAPPRLRYSSVLGAGS